VTVGAARPGQRASTRRAAAAIAVALGLAAAPASARADDACIGAYERTQIARKAGRLVDARAEAMACSQPACPAGMVTECAQWRGEIERALPSVILAFERPDGTDAVGAEVTIDGAKVEVTGLPLPLDPGAHTARVSLDGFEPLEQRFLLQEGEQRRRISGTLAAIPPPSRVPALVFAGVAAVSFGLTIGFGTSAAVDHSELSARCAPGCSPEEAAGVRRKTIAADISLGVGVASLAAAAYFFFRPAPQVTAAIAPTWGGGKLNLEWRL
jgi:hypothetical protein